MDNHRAQAAALLFVVIVGPAIGLGMWLRSNVFDPESTDPRPGISIRASPVTDSTVELDGGRAGQDAQEDEPNPYFVGASTEPINFGTDDLATDAHVTGRSLIPASGVQIRDVALGGDHSCALDTMGTVWCWGDNSSGKLGDGTTSDRAEPVRVALASAEAITAGGGHSCALDVEGTAYCWGLNSDGQLGDGSTNSSTVPIAVAGDHAFVRITAGGNFSCGIEADGAAWCWGANDDGQLGDGTFVDSPVPVAVTGQIRFALVSAGGRAACGLDAQGEAWCWGDNTYGQLGDDSPGSNSSSPVAVENLDGADRLSTGDWHTCAVARSRQPVCWGRNDRGQLGTQSRDDRSTAGPLAYIGEASDIAADGHHSCLLDADRELLCWGSNGYGEVGSSLHPPDGEGPLTVDTADVLTPAAVDTTPERVVLIATGNWHNCALGELGHLFCWGSNVKGGLGVGDDQSRPTPTRVNF